MVKPRTESARPTNVARVATAVISVIAIIIIAVQFRSRSESIGEGPKSIRTKEFTWACERDGAHTFEHRFRYDPLPCRLCDAKCFIELEYTCPEHNRDFNALVDFRRPAGNNGAQDPPGVPVIDRYRHAGLATWIPCDGTIPCPAPGCKASSDRRETSWTPTKARNAPGE